MTQILTNEQIQKLENKIGAEFIVEIINRTGNIRITNRFVDNVYPVFYTIYKGTVADKFIIRRTYIKSFYGPKTQYPHPLNNKYKKAYVKGCDGNMYSYNVRDWDKMSMTFDEVVNYLVKYFGERY